MLHDHDCEEPKPPPGGLEARLQSLAAPPVPGNLLDRCLATIDHAEETSIRPIAVALWSWRRFAAVAAAVLFLGLVGFLARPRNATAAGFLQSVRSTWTEVPACHRVVILKGPAIDRTEETWYARGKGGRSETRSGGTVKGVVVNNGRWEFRWDVPGRLVAAWSTRLLGRQSEFEHAGLIQNNEALVHWAETHKADIRIEQDTYQGRAVRKVTLRWPGAGDANSRPQVDTIWFDPDSLLPLRQRSEQWDGMISEAVYDYPARGMYRPTCSSSTRPPT